MRLVVGLLVSVMACQMAIADDRTEIRKPIECVTGENFTKMADKLAGLGPDRIDTINTNPSITFKALDDGALPRRVFYKDGDGEQNLSISEEGEVENFVALYENNGSAEFCVEDPTRAGQPKGEDVYSVGMSFNMNFLNTSGEYSMEELEDGLKDGKAALKKIIGGPVAMLAPKMSHVWIEYDDETAPADLKLYKDGEFLTDVAAERLGPAYMVEFKALKKMKGDTLRVGGGAHTLSPSLSPKKMAKLIGEPGETGESDQE